MITISCPLCFGPTEVSPDGSTGTCQVGHVLDEAELVRGLQEKADLALWAALRALDDQAAYGRLRQEVGKTVPLTAALAAEQVETLRDFIRSRATAG